MTKKKCEVVDCAEKFRWFLGDTPKYTGRYLVHVDINYGKYSDVTFANYSEIDHKWLSFDHYPLPKSGVIENIRVIAWAKVPWPNI